MQFAASKIIYNARVQAKDIESAAMSYSDKIITDAYNEIFDSIIKELITVFRDNNFNKYLFEYTYISVFDHYTGLTKEFKTRKSKQIIIRIETSIDELYDIIDIENEKYVIEKAGEKASSIVRQAREEAKYIIDAALENSEKIKDNTKKYLEKTTKRKNKKIQSKT